MWVAALVLGMACGARADRDIVYAARYYYPPRGPAHISHSHLYRINADGSGRTQLTFGEHDDLAPVWSPDGRRVLFVRTDLGGSAPFAEMRQWLCVVGASGGRVAKVLDLGTRALSDIRWSPDGRTVAIMPDAWSKEASVLLVSIATRRAHRLAGVTDYVWSPDGRHVYVEGASLGARIEATAGGAEHEALPVQSPVWLSSRRLAGIEIGHVPTIALLDAAGRRVRAVKLAGAPSDEEGKAAVQGGFYAMQAIPGTEARVVVVQNCHNSTTGTNYCFYTADLRTGVVRSLIIGQFVAWSSDGSRFCAAPGRDTGPYGKKSDGSVRTVWVAPLKVGTAGGKLRTITPGTVWVVGADWRKPRASAAHGRKR